LSRYSETLDELRDKVPVPFPLRVSRRKLKGGLQGYCKLSKISPLSLSIVVDKGLSDMMQSDVLIHEWAHALLAAHLREFYTHGPLWGLMYARCYSAVYPD
jgi:hypothetical protein